MKTPSTSPRRAIVAGFLAVLGVASTATAALQVDVIASPNPPRPGELVDVEIILTNDGGADLTDVSAVLDIPANIDSIFEAYFDGDCSPGTSCEAGETATFFVADLPAGKGTSFLVPITVAAGVINGTIIDFDVQAIDDAVIEDTATASVTVSDLRELELAIVEDRDPVAPGDMITYTLSYGLLETSPGISGATLRMPVPPGMTFVGASEGGTEGIGEVEWSLGDLDPADRGVRRATFLVGGGVATGTSIAVEATLDDGPRGSSDAVAYSTATRVEAAIPLELSIVANPDPVRPGETMDLEVMVTNTGNFDRTGIVLRVEYPDLLDSLSEAYFDGDCSSGTTCEFRERAIFTIGTLSPGEGVAYSLPVRVAASTPSGSVITFDAEVFDNPGDLRESAASVTVDATRELELALVENRDPASPGSRIIYTLTYGLQPPSAGAPGTTMQLPVPTGTTFVSASAGGTLSSGVVTWALGDLNPGVSGERTMTVEVDGGAGEGTIVSAEALIGDTASPTHDLRYQTATRVQQENPLELRITASPDPARPLEVLDVELTITNDGPFDRSDVVARVEIPDHLASLSETYFTGDCNSGTTCESRESAIFSVGTLEAGRGATFFMPFQVAAGTPDGTVISLEADVVDSQGDFRETGTSLVVRDVRELDLALVELDEPVAPGSLLTYTLTYGTIISSGGAPDAMLAFHVPDNATFVSASDNGSFDGTDTVSWSVGGLNRGAGGSRRVTVLVDGAADPGDVVAANASLVYPGAPEEEIRFSEETRLESSSPLDVELTVSPTPSAPGGLVNIVLAVTNTEALARTDVLLLLDTPESLDSFGDAAVGGNCPGTTCEFRELVEFDIAVLGAGETMTFPIQTHIAAAASSGTVLNFDVLASDSTGFVGADGDAIMIGSEFDPAFGADLDEDGVVGVTDLLAMLALWGPCPEPDDCIGDIDGDGFIGVIDLLALLAAWG